MSKNTSASIILKNHLSEIERVTQHLDDFSQQHGLPELVNQHLALALDELFANIVSYAYEDSDEHVITLNLNYLGGAVTMELVDDGVAFDPTSTPPPDLVSPLEERPIGGLGIHLVRNVMDRIEYQRDQQMNKLLLTKNLSCNT